MLKSLKKQNTLDLIWQLFRTDFKLRYNDSVLGFVWVLMKPFSIFLIMYFILTRVFPNNDIPNFAVYLLIGNVFMTFWNDGTSMGMDSLLSRAGLITKINFPRYIVLISSTGIAVVNFLINCVIVAVFMYFSHVSPSLIHIIWFFVCAGILYLLILVVSMFLSIIYVRLRDLKQIWELFMQILFWSTPVFYNYFKVSQNSEIMRILLSYVNPISVLLVSSRNGLMSSDIILQNSVFMWVGLIVFIGAFGYLFYKKQIKKIAEFF